MKHIMIFLINIYQSLPLEMHKACRFYPTCSEYSKEAYKTFGFIKGTKLTIKRLLRCHPFGKSGYDPVIKCNGGKDEKEI